MEGPYDLVFRENYGLRSSSQRGTQISTKAPKIENVAGIVSLAIRLGISILRDSGNSRFERTNLAAGVSSRTSVFPLKRGVVELDPTESPRDGKLVASKHIPKGHVESEEKRYEALVRDMLFLSHEPIARHISFVDIIAIGWEDFEDAVQNRIYPVLLLDFAEYGTLEDFFELDDTEKTWNTKQGICCDIAAALDWLHSCSIVHSDIKFRNVLVFTHPDQQESRAYKAKLCDFGFALDVDVLKESGLEAARLDGFTPPCAPEAESLIPLSLLTKFDVFSYGLLVGRVFLNGDDSFSKDLQGHSYDPLKLVNDFEESCNKFRVHSAQQVQLLKKIMMSTTSKDAASRIDMANVLQMISTLDSEEKRTQRIPATVEREDEDEDEVSAIPNGTQPQIEEVWAMGVSTEVSRTLVADIFRDTKARTAESDADDESRQSAAKGAYQLYLAHLIGFGCDCSVETAIDQLLRSASLGFEDAQREAFGCLSALGIDIPPHVRKDMVQWLTQGALHGDKACLNELQILDQAAYQAIARSNARSKTMCEGSGFMFDDDFIEMNDVGDVKGLITAIQGSGEPMDSDIGGGMTWLHYAVFTSSLEFATVLVDGFNCQLNPRNWKGHTPLWLACLSGNYKISLFLLARGADASIGSDSGSNPLHHLAAFENEFVEEIARMLKANGADVNGRNALGMTPLHYAVRGSGNLEEEPSVRVLLELGANPLIMDEDETPLDAAVYALRPFYLDRFLECTPLTVMPKAQLHKILANAARIAQLVRRFHTDDVVAAYVANHPGGFTPLHDAYAWASGDLAAEMIKLPNAKLDELDTGEYGYTAVMIAVRLSTQADIEKLIEAGADLCVTARTGENILHHCVQWRPSLLPYVCRKIEERRGDLLASMCNQSTFWKGETPLDYALSLGQPKSALFLLQRGANPNLFPESKENGGLLLNSLRFCLSPPNVRMLKLLIPHMESKSFACSSDGISLLYVACMHVPDESKATDGAIAPVINCIIDHCPSSIEARYGSSLITPLHMAAAYGNLTAVKILLRRGANALARDSHGQTPIEVMIDDDEELIDRDGNVVVGIVKQRL
ncbi:serine threonine kinase, partial [Fusarium mundagurra]